MVNTNTSVGGDSGGSGGSGEVGSSSGANKNRSYTRDDLSVFNLLEHPVWVFDIEKKAMWWANSSAVTLWNATSLEELLARDFASDMSTATARQLKDYMRRFHKGETVPQQWTYYPKGRGPTTCDIIQSGITIDDQKKQRPRMAMLCEGVEQKQVKEEIDRAKLRDCELLRHLPVAVGQFDKNGKIMQQNPEALDLFGQETVQHECNYDKCSVFASRFVDEELGRKILKEVLDKEDTYRVEAQLHTKARGQRWFAVEARQSTDPVLNDTVILYSARDITELIQAKKEADEANIAKTEFLAVMAHEIRTPLHQVIGFAELLKQSQLDREQTEFLTLMHSSSITLMTVINDLLDYTKIEAGKMQLEQIPFEWKGVIDSLLAVISPKAEAKGLTVERNISSASDTPDRLLGDPNRIRQILLNLCTNAIKFTHEGGITLKVKQIYEICEDEDPSEEGDEFIDRLSLRFSVSDTGVGIGLEHQEIIFQKYSQADASVARTYGGTGLGLSICKSLAEAMGGTIGIDSELGRGSTFWVDIPFLLPDEPSNRRLRHMSSTSSSTVVTGTGDGSHDDTADDSATAMLNKNNKNMIKDLVAQQNQDTSNLMVLVAEDDPVSQKVTSAMVKQLGHFVKVVENGKEAVNEAMTKRYDLILMDYRMPEMNGGEATRIIRDRGLSVDELPIIGLTADYRTAGWQNYKDYGMNICIGKPVQMKDLQSTINEIMGPCLKNRAVFKKMESFADNYFKVLQKME